MKANELRLGNFFIEENSKEIIEVIGLEKNRVVFSGMFLEKWQAKPIELTEEWLLSFGLISNPYQDIYYLDDFVLDIDKTKKFLEIYYKNTKLEFVHRLQNLYFEIKNKELTTKQ